MDSVLPVKTLFGQRRENTDCWNLKRRISNQTLPLRLQAYERLVLFIERVNPANMLIRLNGTAYTAAELYSMIVRRNPNEYQHNVTQQIYVSSRAWAVVKRVKDDTLEHGKQCGQSIARNATGLELSKTILAHLSQLEENPYEIGRARPWMK